MIDKKNCTQDQSQNKCDLVKVNAEFNVFKHEFKVSLKNPSKLWFETKIFVAFCLIYQIVELSPPYMDQVQRIGSWIFNHKLIESAKYQGILPMNPSR